MSSVLQFSEERRAGIISSIIRSSFAMITVPFKSAEMRCLHIPAEEIIPEETDKPCRKKGSGSRKTTKKNGSCPPFEANTGF